ncbi:unnamed protein product [Hyaloperonospora brassicae]|uniref:PH domain-containing protein n=1 Tax=Hyaloperonospora brassicae TaxID=162125 RepID=A0AAV0UZT4_HYABA|nr:unnamed protein product [Hyaloperonospora brassicae]
MTDRTDANLRASSPSNKFSSSSSKGAANFRTEEIRGYLLKKTREGKWQKRWFETNGCFLTYYKKQDGPGLFTIELNERVYTIKASSHDEAAFWVDALLWRQAGGMVKKSLEVNKQTVGDVPSMDLADSVCSSAASTPTNSMYAEKMGLHHADVMSINPDNVGKNGAPCAACCVVQ